MYRVRVRSTGWPGAPGLNTFYFSADPTPNSTDAAAVLARVRSGFVQVAPDMPNTTQFTFDQTVDVINEVDGALISSLNVAPVSVLNGGGSSGPGPVQVMFGLKLESNDIVNGRRRRGRAFIGPVKSSATNQATPPGGSLTLVATMGSTLIGTLGTTTAPLVVWHRPGGALPGSKHLVASAPAATKWFTLRSRLN